MAYHFLRWKDFKDKALTLSYDDNVVYDKKLIGIMQKHGLKGTFNVNSGLFAEESGGRKLTKAEAVELYTQSGMEVAVHGVKHLSLAEVDEAMATLDIASDREALEDAFSCVIKGMAYANGSVSDQAVEVLKKCGINYARTVQSTERFDIPTDWLRLPATCHHNNPKLMQLAEEFLSDHKNKSYWWRKAKLFYLWGHSFEFNDNDNWDVIEKFAAYMGGRNDVWYATNGEIYEYVKAYDRLEFSIAGKWVYNPSAIDVYLNYFDKEIVVPAGKTVAL